MRVLCVQSWCMKSAPESDVRWRDGRTMATNGMARMDLARHGVPGWWPVCVSLHQAGQRPYLIIMF